MRQGQGFGSRIQRVASAGRAIGFRVAGAAMQLGLSVLLGRVLGADGLGIYFAFLALVTFAGGVGSAGYPLLSLRQVSRFADAGQLSAARRFWIKALTVTALTGVAIVGLAVGTRELLAGWLFNEVSLVVPAVLAGLSTLPFMALATSAETLKGTGRGESALLLQHAATPTLALTVVAAAWLGGAVLTPTAVIAVYTGALSLVAGITLLVVNRVLPAGNVGDVGSASDAAATTTSWAFWVAQVGGQSLAQVPLLLLPLYASRESVGLFGVAARLVSVAALVLIGVASIYAPHVAGRFQRREGVELRRLLTETQMLAVAGYVPLFVVFIFGGRWILGAFGSEFPAAYHVLIVLALGQLVNSATGIVTYFNLMTEQERFEAGMVAGALALMTAVWMLGQWSSALPMAFVVAGVLALKNIASFVRVIASIRRLRASPA